MSETFGPYDVIARVAAGSTGIVYRVHHRELDRDAAVKELSVALRGVPGLVERMRVEAETLASLDSEHIVKIYDFVEESDRVWIAEQWVDGASLEKILTTSGSLSAEQAVGVIHGALSGLAYAHDQNIVHRDIAPTNILADANGTSMLVDFGLAAPVGELTAEGTPAFMSPEAARGAPVSKASDVYSAAAVLFALLAGRPPFSGSDPAAVVRQHAEAAAPALDGHGEDLKAVVARALDKDPANRPPDAAAFLAALEQAAERRFGAGWLARASIAPLVATATAAGVAGVTAGAGASATQTVLVDSASVATGSGGSGAALATSAPRKILGLGLKKAVAVGVATVVVVGAAIAGATAYSNHQDQVQADKAAAKKAAAKKAQIAAFAANAPDGEWAVTSKVISTDFDDESVGDTQKVTWTFVSTCAGLSCSGTIKSDSGKSWAYTWDGTSVTREQPADETYKGPCVDDVTGEESPGTSAVATFVTLLGPITVHETSAEGAPTSMTGMVTGTESYSDYVDCETSKPRVSENKLVLKRK
jgi:serine/threonine-protein kinase